MTIIPKSGRSRTTGHYRAEILERIEESGGYGVPRGFLHEPYETSLHRALRQLDEEGLVTVIDCPEDNSHLKMLAEFGCEIWGRT